MMYLYPYLDFDFKNAVDVNYIPYPVETVNDKKSDPFFINSAEYCPKIMDIQKKEFLKAESRVINLYSFKKPIQNAIDTLDLNVKNTAYENLSITDCFVIADFLLMDIANAPTP